MSQEILSSTVGVKMDLNGISKLSKDAFLAAMASGHMHKLLTDKNVAHHRMGLILTDKKTSINPMSPVGAATDLQLASGIRDRIVAWTLRRKQAAASFSGAVQLLLLAHTPVSRKVFQWFHCNNISGRWFLRADVSCFCVLFV